MGQYTSKKVGKILALPEDLILIIMLFLNSSFQLKFAKTCKKFYAYYLEHLAAILYVGDNKCCRLLAMNASKTAQNYLVGSNCFLNHQFIQPKDLKDFQNNVRYPIKGLSLYVKDEELLNVIGDLNEKFISSLTSFALSSNTINITKVSIIEKFAKLPLLKYFYFRDCKMSNLDLSKIFANSNQIQRLELVSNWYSEVLTLPRHLKSLIISGFQYSNLDVDISKCIGLEYMEMEFDSNGNLYRYMGRVILSQAACLRELHCMCRLFIKDFQDQISALYNLEKLDLEFETLKRLCVCESLINMPCVTGLTRDTDHLYNFDFSLFKKFKKISIHYFQYRGNLTFTIPKSDDASIDLEVTWIENKRQQKNFLRQSKKIMLSPEKSIKISINFDFQITIEEFNC